jgi:hypothetical protein
MRNKRLNWTQFLKWLFVRIVFPLSPIIVSFLAEYFFQFGTFSFPDERILVFSFLLPIIYLQEADGPITRNALYCVSLLCLVFFVFAVIAKQPQNVQAFPSALGKIYFAGGVAFGLEVMVALIYEFARSLEDKPDVE